MYFFFAGLGVFLGNLLGGLVLLDAVLALDGAYFLAYAVPRVDVELWSL